MKGICNEIDRSNDPFILHHLDHHDGMIPLWAAVEIMSFGTLSKTVKNLKTGVGSPAAHIASFYRYQKNGKTVTPSMEMLTSWIQAVSSVRNMCAHNSRLYNRSMSTSPQILDADKLNPKPRFTGIYEITLALKYLRPFDAAWLEFDRRIHELFQQYNGTFEMARMNFPADWEAHYKL